MNDMRPVPFLSVIIIAWKNTEYLLRCLDCLRAQSFKDFEVQIINNGLADASLNVITEKPQSLNIRMENLGSNFGFATANNIGVQHARGKWIALLNADAFPEPDWLEKLLNATEEDPQYSMFSSRQIQHISPDRLDGAGDAYHISGLAWRNYYNYPSKGYGAERKEVFSPCAAAALYSREEFLRAGGFDEDYFSYFEDVDLGFRLRLGGAKCLYVPEAVVSHVGSASTGKRSDFSVYYGYRNMIWTFVKDMPSPYFWVFLPLHVITLLFFFAYLTARGQGNAISRAILGALRELPKALAKRKLVQKNLKIKSGDLLKVMSTGLLEPYREFINRNRSK